VFTHEFGHKKTVNKNHKIFNNGGAWRLVQSMCGLGVDADVTGFGYEYSKRDDFQSVM
jgi:hypothetical protein